MCVCVCVDFTKSFVDMIFTQKNRGASLLCDEIMYIHINCPVFVFANHPKKQPFSPSPKPQSDRLPPAAHGVPISSRHVKKPKPLEMLKDFTVPLKT